MGIGASVFGRGTGLQVGDDAPPVELKDHTGAIVNLADYHGKQSVVLFFYPKDETAGCIREVCAFRDDFEAFQQVGAEVIGVSTGSEASHERFAGKYRLPFRLLVDTNGAVRKAFKVPTALGFIQGRVTYVIDKQGKIAHAFNSQMRPALHVQQALQVLEQLG